jgi:hypothetical protein
VTWLRWLPAIPASPTSRVTTPALQQLATQQEAKCAIINLNSIYFSQTHWATLGVVTHDLEPIPRPQFTTP